MELLCALLALLFGAVCANAGIHGTQTEGPLDQLNWVTKYPACGGTKQSPIDIQRSNVRHNPDMPQLELTGYDAQKGNFLMSNNGRSVQIDLPPTMAITKGLPEKYTAVKMRLHWGGGDQETSGAEHTIDGIRNMGELHLVHYNSDKYKSFTEARDKTDGLAVLAFFFEDGHFENTYYSDFINNLVKIKHGESMNISSLDVRSMLPENMNNFFRYQGSLTTPPCYESILWTVLDTPITLSQNQIRTLESTLTDTDKKVLWNEYRTAQPLNGREVESSFLPSLAKGSFCRQDEIESKLLKIEGMITSLGKQMNSGGLPGSGSSNQDPRVIFPLVLDFLAKDDDSYALARFSKRLSQFTACMHIRTESDGVHTILSYSYNGIKNELMISFDKEVGLWIGDELISLPQNFKALDWVNYCITWSSNTGAVDLWVNGKLGEQRYLKKGYDIIPGGRFILGNDQDGMNAFVGKMTDVNVWDRVLVAADIQNQMSCERNGTVVGNVISWGTTPLRLYGGVMLGSQYRCK